MGIYGAIPTENKKHPVTAVEWNDCIIWCNAYTEKTLGLDRCVYRTGKNGIVLKNGMDWKACNIAFADIDKKGYRLPTEAEWEYAARWQGGNQINAEQYETVWLTKLNSASGATKPAAFKNLLLPNTETWETLRDETTRVAVYDEWWNGNSLVPQNPQTTRTSFVGSKKANALGLWDMSGNVFEWCFDWYAPDVTASDEISADGFVVNPKGPTFGEKRILRGGSFDTDTRFCIVGIRCFRPPTGGNFDIGFRFCRSVE